MIGQPPRPSQQGCKDDGEKPRWFLLPWKQLEQVARVITFGADKYSPDNWQHVNNARERYFSAGIRHLTEWQKGQRLDSESGLPHLAHALCCLLFLMWFDDREKKPKEVELTRPTPRQPGKSPEQENLWNI